MGNSNFIEKNYNNLMGERLRASRKRMNLSQEELALRVSEEGDSISPNYISMIETGRRTPSKKKIKILARILNVPVEYLSGLSNTIDFKPLHYASDDYIDRDIAYINLLEKMGNAIQFNIVHLYDGIKPKEVYIRYFDKTFTDYGSLEKSVSIDDIENISFFDGKCIHIDGNYKVESVISSVVLNDLELSIGQFKKVLEENISNIQKNIDDIPQRTFGQLHAEILDEKVETFIKASRDKTI